jgi:hypothetical protein
VQWLNKRTFLHEHFYQLPLRQHPQRLDSLCAAVVVVRCDVFSQTAIPLQLGHRQVHVLPVSPQEWLLLKGPCREMTADKSHAVAKVNTVIKKSELQGGYAYYRQARSGL